MRCTYEELKIMPPGTMLGTWVKLDSAGLDPNHFENTWANIATGKCTHYSHLADLDLPQASALKALGMVISTIKATGGAFRDDDSGELVLRGDPEWLDLAEAYEAACDATGTPLDADTMA